MQKRFLQCDAHRFRFMSLSLSFLPCVAHLSHDGFSGSQVMAAQGFAVLALFASLRRLRHLQ